MDGAVIAVSQQLAMSSLELSMSGTQGVKIAIAGRDESAAASLCISSGLDLLMSCLVLSCVYGVHMEYMPCGWRTQASCASVRRLLRCLVTENVSDVQA